MYRIVNRFLFRLSIDYQPAYGEAWSALEKWVYYGTQTVERPSDRRLISARPPTTIEAIVKAAAKATGRNVAPQWCTEILINDKAEYVVVAAANTWAIRIIKSIDVYVMRTEVDPKSCTTE